jgi:hypothetical protein
MGEQIEHLRDIPLEVRAEPPPVPPAAELTRRVVHAETLGIEQADRILALEAALQTAEQQLTYWKTCALEAEAHLQIAEQARDEWHHEQKETEKALIALQARFDEAIHAYEQAKATLTQIRALPRSHRASTYEHLGRYEAGPFVRADELDRLLNALPETPKKSD